MKFNSKLDAQTFLTEIKAFDQINKVDESYSPSMAQIKEFLKTRTPLVKKLKDHRKSSGQKANWRENRQNMMKGIKAFHRSVDGKRFHKRLGRFLASRIFQTKSDAGAKKTSNTQERNKAKNESNDAYQMLMTKQGYLKGLNSLKQHLFVELEYFHQLQEHVELEEFIIDYALPYFQRLEEKIVKDTELTEDEEVFLFDLVDKKSIMQFLSERSSKEFAEIENLWNSITSSLKKKKILEDSSDFYPEFVARFKKELNK